METGVASISENRVVSQFPIINNKIGGGGLMQKISYYCPYGLIRFVVIWCCSVVALIIGFWGITGAGLAPEFNAPMKLNNSKVLAAAPFKVTRIGVEKWVFVTLKAPPEYSNVMFSKVQLSQLRPSSCWVPLAKMLEEKTILPNGGTLGIAASTTTNFDSADADCTVVDIWFPNKNITNTPDTNDPNAIVTNDPNVTVTLYITPPLNNKKSNCVIWHRHYGKPPPQRPNKIGNAFPPQFHGIT